VTPGATVTACDLTVLTPPAITSTVTEAGPTVTQNAPPVTFTTCDVTPTVLPPVTFTETQSCEFTKGPYGPGGSSSKQGPSGYGTPAPRVSY
jgi:hypothetical protein